MLYRWKRLVMCSLCLATLLLAAGPPLKSSAAPRMPRLPQSPAYCAPKEPEDTGISYVSGGTYSYEQGNWYSTWFGLFNYWATDAGNPATWYGRGVVSVRIGAWLCQSGDILLLLTGGQPLWYNVEISVPGGNPWVEQIFTYTADPLVSNLDAIDLAGLTAKQYIFSAQSCTGDDNPPNDIVCSGWSPPLLLTAASNSNCQNGYVWRQAAPFDHVCVQPWEAAQVAYDKSQRYARGNINYYQPNACNPGYVWREAWGGDYTCVDPPQRDQVLSDNSQALNRIVVL